MTPPIEPNRTTVERHRHSEIFITDDALISMHTQWQSAAVALNVVVLVEAAACQSTSRISGPQWTEIKCGQSVRGRAQ